MADFKGHGAPDSATGPRNDLCPELILEMVAPSDLEQSKFAVRKVTNRQRQKAMASIKKFGFVAPILATSDNEIIDGHVRLAAAQSLGLNQVPVIRIDHLSDVELRALRIAINKVQETGEWDETALRLELAYQLEFNTDLTDLGFEAPELDLLLQISAGEVEEPDAADEIGDLPSPDAPSVSEEGDVWRLGDHLILCGNCRNAGTVSRLFGTTTAGLVFTDPPYNVPINGHVRVATDRFDEFAEASGELSEEAFTAFLASFIQSAKQVSRPGALFYVFMDWRHMREILEAIRASGFDMINLCVWAKPNGGMGSFYRSRHEMVFVFREPGWAHTNNIELGRHGRYRTNVWEYAGATGGKKEEADDFSLHPTVKPVRLVADAILDATVAGETVFDPFLGSGTTLLAAERTKRRCIGIEISPAYVDVAIRRWEAMTGREAVHVDSGDTFSERSLGQPGGICTGTTSGTSTGTSVEDF